ncbi:hypothetical protein BCAR13_440044 [Paraburkholderia caribensis]|nr:hypothetical protein BCAR13_440044 [Paraburkholderia caribensis]
MSLGIIGYASRPLAHPSRVDGSPGPSYATLGEAYVHYQKDLFSLW